MISANYVIKDWTTKEVGESGWPGANMAYNAGKTFNIDSEIDFFLTEAFRIR